MIHLRESLAWIEIHWKSIGAIGTPLVPIIGFAPKILRTYDKFRDRRAMAKRENADLYPLADLLAAGSSYVEPNCQSLDPSGAENYRQTVPVEENAHRQLQKLLAPESTERYSLLLADSGMGKTTLLLNVYARHCKKKKTKYKLAIVPLGSAHSDKAIEGIRDKPNTVLLLDAFDEDAKAMTDHRRRLAELFELAHEFSKVLITCRTQFFEKEDEIPKEAGVARFGTVRAGETKEYKLRKIYLSPFNEDQIDEYIRKQFPFWQFHLRSEARAIASQMSDLTVRPMLLAHIRDLLEQDKPFHRSADIYNTMIDAWIERESRVIDSSNLRKLSVELATRMYLDRGSRGAERMPPEEAMRIAKSMRISLPDMQLRARSLLNHDAEGNYKFSHRTIMEFLFICNFVEALPSTKVIEWTDQMKKFWWDLVSIRWEQTGQNVGAQAEQLIQHGRSYGDLEGFFDLGPRPFVNLRSNPRNDQGSIFDNELQHLSVFNITHKRRTKRFPSFFEGGLCGIEGSDAVAIEFVSGLMWQSECANASTRDVALERVKEMNQMRFAGYSNWRLPTLCEALTLLPTSIKSYSAFSPTYPFSCFEKWANAIWTIDSSKTNFPMAFSFKGKTAVATQSETLEGSLISVRCVRTHLL